MPNKTDDELVDWIHDELKDAKSRLSTWRTHASECYDYYAIEQWSDEDRQQLLESQRQAVTFDRITRTINAVAGTMVQNQQEITYHPREVTDSGVAEIMTAAARWVRDLTDAEDEELEMFIDLLICGMGWCQETIDADLREPRILSERIDPLSVLWDPRARRANLVDAKWKARLKRIQEDDILARWPDADLGTAERSTDYLEYASSPRDVTPPRYRPSRATHGNEDDGDDGYEVIEFHYWVHETYHQVLMPSGELVELDAAAWKREKEKIEAAQLRYANRQARVYYTAYVVGQELLENEKAIAQDGFTLHTVTGLRHRNNNTWFALVSMMLDPQRWANKWLSQILHVVNSNAKGGLLAESDAFESVRKAEDSWSASDSIVWLKAGGLQKIQERSFGQVPAGVDRLLQYALDAITDVPGVNVEMLGLANRNQPGVLEDSRKQAGITIVAVFFNSMRRYHKEHARVLMELIRTYIADGRLMRIVGDSGAQYVPMLKDQMALQYDVIVDEAPTSPNTKQRSFEALLQVLPLAMQAGIQVPPEIIEYAPLPSALVEKWKAVLAPDEDPEAKAQAEELKQLNVAATRAAVAETQSRAELNSSTAVVQDRVAANKARELEISAVKLAADAQMRALELAAKTANDKQKLDQEAAAEEHALALKTMELTHKAEIEQLKLMVANPGISLPTRDSGVLPQVLESLADLHRVMMCPRRRDIVRDARGRATHAIESIVVSEGAE